MKKTVKILLIILILALICTAIIVFLNYDRTIDNLNLKIIQSKEELEVGKNVLLSGKIEFPEGDINDEEYKLGLPYKMVKRVRNVAESSGWVDEEPVYLASKCYLNDIYISEDLIKPFVKETLITDYRNINFENSDIIPTRYTDSENLFLTTWDEMGFWRLKYYSREIDTDKTYTIIGKWDGEKVIPIEGIEKSIYEGELSIKDIKKEYKSKAKN